MTYSTTQHKYYSWFYNNLYEFSDSTCCYTDSCTKNPISKAITLKQNINCANCGGVGHIYKQCNHPITSFGVICFRLSYNHQKKEVAPQFLMVQRKDSLSYVEYIRGKYSFENKSYILKLFSNMTESERCKIAICDFNTLWKELWQIKDCTAFMREYNESKAKFNLLKVGYMLKNPEDGSLLFFDLKYVLDNSMSELEETEWGFPKGRRNINEDDFSCAFREFSEETNIHPDNVGLVTDVKPFEEIFTGSNHVRYKHIYYVAVLLHNDSKTNALLNPYNKSQCKEVKDIKWMWYNDAQSKIREQNIERKELFRRVYNIIEKNISMINKSVRHAKKKQYKNNKVA